MPSVAAAHELERRKQVRLKLRGDLQTTPQRYEGRTYFVVKDPVTLRYYRFKEQEHFLLGFMNGKQTLDEAQQAYEKRYRPERLTLEDLEGFAQQLLTAGLVQNESPRAGQQLMDRRKKRQRSQLMQTLTNVLYIRIPLFDPEHVLTKLVRRAGFFFSLWFFALASCVMFGAVALVLTHFETFRTKLPSYHEFFSFKTVIYLWIALGVVKVIHEFGHGLSCKKFGGEVHEMGLLFLVFSPAMYCNVSDSWTLPSKWKRIVISAAGIYVELLIASVATFVWWNTPTQPFINNLSLSLMVVCSVSTIVFNANPLMRYDGYYVLADWIEIPNLRERANRYLTNRFLETFLGVEVPPEPYMASWRKKLFIFYAVTSYVYRWVITYFILFFLYNFLKPYRLGVISGMLALASLGSMVGWPLYRLAKNIHQRGRLPDMKPVRVVLTSVAAVGLLLLVLVVPLPVSRVSSTGVVELRPEGSQNVVVQVAQTEGEKAILEVLYVREGQRVKETDQLARFSNRDLVNRHKRAETEREAIREKLSALQKERDRPGLMDRDRDLIGAEITNTETRLSEARNEVDLLEKRLGHLIITAPRDGIVMGLPRIEDVGKQWDKTQPLCRIGDPTQMRVIIPVVPSDYALLQENMGGIGGRLRLPASVRVPGMSNTAWRGEVNRLPESEATRIPLALSNRANGPVAVKPTSDPQKLEPQTQQYLVNVDITDPEARVRPGVQAKVKIHCQKRTLRWWIWRSINDTFDLGL
jgi:putative peptide zinc metalloprotease protein